MAFAKSHDRSNCVALAKHKSNFPSMGQRSDVVKNPEVRGGFSRDIEADSHDHKEAYDCGCSGGDDATDSGEEIAEAARELIPTCVTRQQPMAPTLCFQAANDLMDGGGKVDLQIAELLHDRGAPHPCPQTKNRWQSKPRPSTVQGSGGA